MPAPEPAPALFCWSGGKDSALALHELRREGRFEVVALATTVTAGYDRISIHGVRRALLEAQARALGLPLATAEIAPHADNAAYEAAMGALFRGFRERGVRHVVFGDLYLEDVRRYREGLAARAGLAPLFPLWGRDTREVAQEFIRLGYRAVTVCVDTRALSGAFAGRDYDAAFLRDLPPDVDPCGEDGEFHTFVHDGPPFREPLRFARGEVVLRDARFLYCELVPATCRTRGQGDKGKG